MGDVSEAEKRRYRTRHPTSFDVEKGEFLCPLCRSLSNSVIPLIPQYHLLQEPALSSVNNLTLLWPHLSLLSILPRLLNPCKKIFLAHQPHLIHPHPQSWLLLIQITPPTLKHSSQPPSLPRWNEKELKNQHNQRRLTVLLLELVLPLTSLSGLKPC